MPALIRRRSALVALAAALAALPVLPTAAHAGPPFVSIELPANPFDQTSREGVYAPRKQWAEVTQGAGNGNTVTALVEIGENGMVAVRVPTERNREGWDIPKRVTSAGVDTALRARAAKGK